MFQRNALFPPAAQSLRFAVFLPIIALLSGCDSAVLFPSGYIAAQQRDLLVVATLLMLLIIVPVIALTIYFAWRYRASNKEATYAPDWDHSTKLELVIWSAPLLIIVALGAITWQGTHTLDPYRPIERIDASTPLDPKVKPLEVDVVALDWKWLFIMPEYGIATVNELAAPVNRPIHFNITASSVMNSFYIPALAGQIYAMPGMQTQLNGVINKPGNYEGFSANYSGAGFSDMHFRFYGLDQTGFDQWVAKNRASDRTLDRAAYLTLEKPSDNVPVMRFGTVEQGLFNAALNLCVRPGSKCADDIMRKDAETARGEIAAGAAPEMHMGGHAMPGAHTVPAEHADKPMAGAGMTPPGARTAPPQAAEAAAHSDTQAL